MLCLKLKFLFLWLLCLKLKFLFSVTIVIFSGLVVCLLFFKSYFWLLCSSCLSDKSDLQLSSDESVVLQVLLWVAVS